jgi:hypothetical protein
MTRQQKRAKAIQDAIVKGLEWAREHGFTKDGDIAIAIRVQLSEAGFRI